MPHEEWPEGYDGHRRAQRKWIAQNTTPEQRMEWLEEMLFMLWENGDLSSKFDQLEPKT